MATKRVSIALVPDKRLHGDLVRTWTPCKFSNLKDDKEIVNLGTLFSYSN